MCTTRLPRTPLISSSLSENPVTHDSSRLNYLEFGVSPYATLYSWQAARAMAPLSGSDCVMPVDLADIALDVRGYGLVHLLSPAAPCGLLVFQTLWA